MFECNRCKFDYARGDIIQIDHPMAHSVHWCADCISDSFQEYEDALRHLEKEYAELESYVIQMSERQ